MRFAIIDTGTNTFHLLIFDKKPGETHEIIHKKTTVVKLGEGGINNNIITPEAFKRGIDCLINFSELCKEFKAEKIFAFSTAALRRAKNAAEFIIETNKKTGIELNIISGDREATLIWKGVRNAVNLTNSISLLMDIGGGSTEFIIANEKEIFWKQSFDLGASLLLDKFKPSDPISTTEILEIENYFNRELEKLFHAIIKFKPDILIGSSGSFDTFADLITHQNNETELLKNSNTYNFNLEDYFLTHQRLVNANRAERLAMQGMLPMRVDMIVVATLLTNFILRKFQITQLKLSTYALKEGVLFELLNI